MYGGISDPRMKSYPPLVRRDLDVVRMGNCLSALALMSPSQSVISQWGWGFHTVRDGIDPEDDPFSSPGCWSCGCWEGFMIRGWYSILPGCRWFHEPHPISDQPFGSGFLHREERCRLGGPSFSSPDRGSCRDMEGFLNCGWDPMVPACGETSMALWLEYSCLASTLKKRTSGVWGRDLVVIQRPESQFRIEIQQQGWLDIDGCQDYLGIVGSAHHATATARRATRPGVLLVVPSSLPTYTTRRG